MHRDRTGNRSNSRSSGPGSNTGRRRRRRHPPRCQHRRRASRRSRPGHAKVTNVSDRPAAMDETTMKFGLLMESAQTHQKLADAHLERLRAHTQDLDGVVREEIRRTLVEELREVTAESNRAVHALRGMKRAAGMR